MARNRPSAFVGVSNRERQCRFFIVAYNIKQITMDIFEKKQNFLSNELQELLPKAETLLDAIRDRKEYLENVGYDICENLAIDIAGKIAYLNYILNDRMPERFWQQRKND